MKWHLQYMLFMREARQIRRRSNVVENQPFELHQLESTSNRSKYPSLEQEKIPHWRMLVESTSRCSDPSVAFCEGALPG